MVSMSMRGRYKIKCNAIKHEYHRERIGVNVLRLIYCLYVGPGLLCSGDSAAHKLKLR